MSLLAGRGRVWLFLLRDKGGAGRGRGIFPFPMGAWAAQWGRTMKHMAAKDLLRELVSLTLGVLLATHLVDGICYDGTGTLALVVALLAVLNALLRPALTSVLVFVCLPLLVATFGLALFPILWLANSLLFFMAGWLLRQHGFVVETFGAAMLGAFIVSVAHFALSVLLREGGARRFGHGGGGRRARDDHDDVIDV